MKRLLKSLAFDEDSQPSQADQASVAHQIADLLQRAKTIGQAHASDETEESIAWGGKFTDALGSAWSIVTNFVQGIADWISGQDAEDLTDEDIEAKVDSLAETVGDTEVASAIEQAVMDELDSQGYIKVQWYAEPDACDACKANAEQGPIPIGSTFQSGDAIPPAHPRCRCSLGMGESG